MTNKLLPPNVDATDRLILFDGVCKLCNAWSQFIIKYDKQHRFILCSVQSEEGKKILKHFALPTDVYETMLYVEGHQYYAKSDAFFRIMAILGYPWKALCLFRLIPKPICYWLYDRVALNRYRLFGKNEYCILPSPDHDKRFLNK